MRSQYGTELQPRLVMVSYHLQSEVKCVRLILFGKCHIDISESLETISLFLCVGGKCDFGHSALNNDLR